MVFSHDHGALATCWDLAYVAQSFIPLWDGGDPERAVIGYTPSRNHGESWSNGSTP
jgi:hypothetical protein